jgi:hypothetical protein
LYIVRKSKKIEQGAGTKIDLKAEDKDRYLSFLAVAVHLQIGFHAISALQHITFLGLACSSKASLKEAEDLAAKGMPSVAELQHYKIRNLSH